MVLLCNLTRDSPKSNSLACLDDVLLKAQARLLGVRPEPNGAIANVDEDRTDVVSEAKPNGSKVPI